MGSYAFLKESKKTHHILKNIIAFILVAPYFTVVFPAFFICQTTLHTTHGKSQSIANYQSFMIDEETNEPFDRLLPHPNDIGKPIDANSFVVNLYASMSDPIYYTWIFRYAPEEYIELKEKFNKEFEYMETYPDYDWEKDIDITRQCNFSVYDFIFRTIQIPDYEDLNISTSEYYDKYDYWALIGTNDETCEIAFIYLTPERYSPTFDEAFIKEDCAWRYYYIKKWFHNL